MLVSFAGEGFSFKPGDIAEREDAEAVRLIERGYAVPAPVDAKEKAVRKPPETRKRGRR